MHAADTLFVCSDSSDLHLIANFNSLMVALWLTGVICTKLIPILRKEIAAYNELDVFACLRRSSLDYVGTLAKPNLR